MENNSSRSSATDSLIINLNTCHPEMITVGVTVAGKEIVATRKARRDASQNLLPLIAEVLQKNNLDISHLSAVTAVQKPGSFTGLRLGTSVANALGYLLNVSVNGKWNPVEIFYTQ